MVLIEGMKGRGKAKVKREGGEKMEGMKKGIVVGVLAAALLVSMVTAASAFWYPPEREDEIPEHNTIVWDLDHNKVMYKSPHDETGSVDISAGGSEVWRADNSAGGSVYFPARTWYVGLQFNSVEDSGKKYTVHVGSWNGMTFTSAGESGWQKFWTNSPYKIDSIVANGFTVPEDEYLALKIESETSVTVTTDGGKCWLLWPLDDPNYPIPEFTTIAIPVGIALLAGFFFLRRKR
jgi:hypothetical protein